ncbi:SLC13 family permease [Treponema sp.]|uniref:SLC13 family permease n=1 Tax=Treponema sp. TaxID=166 RepID=UPI003EFD69AA
MFTMKMLVAFIAFLMYALVIMFQNRKVMFSSGAAVLIIILAAIFPGMIFPLPQDIVALEGWLPTRIYPFYHSAVEIINWNVIMIYLGSMIIASLFIYSKVPVKIADSIVNKSRNTCFAMVAILAMTGIISIFVENVATVLVMAPIGLALCSKLKMNPTFFMMGLAVMSNLEGTATLVGDPPSMIFASYAGYSFNDFFFYSGKPSIFFIIQIGMIAGCAFFYFFFAKNKNEKILVESEKIISWFPFCCLLMMILGLAAVSFINSRFEYLSGTLVISIGIIGLLWFKFSQKKSDAEISKLIKELDWETIFFLIGIFIVIGAIKETGLLKNLAALLVSITGGSKFAGFIIILLVSIAISGFVDNVPYIIAMLPVTGAMAESMETAPELFMFALLVGSCLGGNLTPFGASANIVAMGILKKENYPMKFSGWIKIGVPFTLITTAAASVFLWLVWA